MSILRKIFSKDSLSNGNSSTNGGFCYLKPELQEKLSCGVKYNLKLVIRGERKSGKSTLLSRLKGEAFDPNYTPTDEIKVANILWKYQPTDDAVKVDVWDVVDKGRQREVKHGTTTSGYISKLTKKSQTATAMASLDSTFIDVYKGVNCVILMFDMTSRWTFDYVCRELPNVPHSVPVLVVGNFRDAVATDEANREITETEVRTFIRRMLKVRQSSASDSDTPEFCKQCAPIRYCETSMKNGFGLMYLHRFLNIPFLHLQYACLLQALAVNRQAFSSISQQLDLAEENREVICSYENLKRSFKKAVTKASNRFTRWLENVRGPILSSSPAVRDGMRRETLQPSSITVATSRVDANSKKQASPVKPKKKSVNEPLLPTSVAEDSAFRDFIQKVDSPSTPVSPPTNGLDVNTEPIESSSNSTPVVAAFQEDIDPDDAVVGNVAGGFNGVGGSLRPLADSVDDDLVDDDDDLMNEDEDDDEEQLGPALGLAAFSNEAVEYGRASAKARDGLQPDQLSNLQSPSSSPSSPSASQSSSPHLPNVVPSVPRAPSHDPSADLVTLEERNAFERFLADI